MGQCWSNASEVNPISWWLYPKNPDILIIKTVASPHKVGGRAEKLWDHHVANVTLYNISRVLSACGTACTEYYFNRFHTQLYSFMLRALVVTPILRSWFRIRSCTEGFFYSNWVWEAVKAQTMSSSSLKTSLPEFFTSLYLTYYLTVMITLCIHGGIHSSACNNYPVLIREIMLTHTSTLYRFHL